MKTIHATLALTLMMISGYTVLAQSSASNLNKNSNSPQGKMAGEMEVCKQMMAEMENEKTQRNEWDSKVNALVIRMESATGDEKVNAMSTVIKELVTQRSMMHSMKENMETKKMGHMMDHMKMPMKPGMMDCPMMKGMGGMGGMMGKSQTMNMEGADKGSKALHELMMGSARRMMGEEKPKALKTDKAFALLMSDHHLSAVQMADIELKEGKNSSLRTMAKQIKIAQLREIKELKKLATTQK